MKLPLIYRPKYNYKLIRLGKNNDGGYLVSKTSVLNSNNLISFGIEDDWSFEEQFIKNNNKINVYIYDDNLDLKWLIKRFLKNIKRLIFFELPINDFLISFIRLFKLSYLKKKMNLEKKYISQDDILKIASDKDKIFFKIDIEGSEYRIFDELIKIKNKIEAIVIELHDIDLHKDKITNFIEKIGLEITHIHPNNYSKPDKFSNPTSIELTLEKNFEKENLLSLKLPHTLDQKCDPNTNDYELKFENK